MARVARTLALLACAVPIGAGAISDTDANDARAVLASASGAAVSRTAAENESAAQSDARSLLSELQLPLGATQSAIEPAGDDSLLAHPGVGPPATPNVVDDHAWWIVPSAPAQVLAYIREHLPAGATRTLTSRGLGLNRSSQQPRLSVIDDRFIRWCGCSLLGRQRRPRRGRTPDEW